MCFESIAPWYTKWFNIRPKELVAKKNIAVLKLIKTDNESYNGRIKYEPNTLYSTELGKHRTLLSSSKYRTMKLLIWFIMIYEVGTFEIDQGFHSYSFSFNRMPKKEKLKLVSFTIPKGAKYYYDLHFNEYVSDSIISGDLEPL